MVKTPTNFTQKADTDDIATALDWHKVADAKLVGLQATYAKLDRMPGNEAIGYHTTSIVINTVG